MSLVLLYGDDSVNLVDSESILVEWRSASSVNGAIQRYILYASTTDESVGSVVHNSSQLLPSHVVNNLTAGTQYFIRLEVCFNMS